MATNRPAKVAGAIQKKISEILQKDLRDPRIGFITITTVKVTPDLRYVTVYFSVFGSEKEKKDAQVGLKYATGYIKHRVAEAINLKFAPQIVFKIDDTHEHERRVNELLERIKQEDEERNRQRNKDA